MAKRENYGQIAGRGEFACIDGGYRYEYNGKAGHWRGASDLRWETSLGKAQCGRVVGQRMIDGTRVSVVKVRSKFFAATPPHVKRAGRGPRREAGLGRR
jgi:hypothetical protein